MKLLAPTLLAAALLGGCSMMPPHSSMMASDMPTRAADGRLIGPTGNTLYVFSKDGPGMSNCNAQCAANWPPLPVASTAKPMGDYSIVTRADGSQQWAYRGQPLYYFVKGQKSGDMVGDGVGGSWKIVRP